MIWNDTVHVTIHVWQFYEILFLNPFTSRPLNLLVKINVWLKVDTKPRCQEGQMASTYLGINDVIHLTVTEIQIIMREFRVPDTHLQGEEHSITHAALK